MGTNTKRRVAEQGVRSSEMTPSVRQGARRLEELAAQLDKVWAGESEEDLPPVVIGRVHEPTGDFEGLTPGDWIVVVFDRLDEQGVEGPFSSFEEAIDYAVRDLSIGQLTRLVGVDTYAGREGLDEDDAPDALLEAFSTAPYDAAVEREAIWLELHEDDRLSAIRLFHRKRTGAHPGKGDGWAHAVVHLFAEASLLSGREPACLEAYAAWREAGLTRHEALHALGESIASQLRDATSGDASDISEYLSAISVERYRGTAKD